MKTAFVFVLTVSVFLLVLENTDAFSPKAQKKKTVPRVVVIGGGVAGLTAAARLHNNGFSVTLLEAMNRIGGRTHTLKFDEQKIEMGGEWVQGEKGNSVFELANPLGLLKSPAKSNSSQHLELFEQFGFQTGEILNTTMRDTIFELIEYIMFDPEKWGKDLDDMPMGDFARFILNKFNEVHPIHSDNTFIEAIYDWAHRTVNSDAACDNWFVKSHSNNGEQYEPLEGSDRIQWKYPYSYSSLHQVILTGNATEDGIYDLPEWIKLNAEVTRIEYSTENDTVNVTTRDGTVYTAEHVIFTPSLGVLKANHMQLFQPPLSQKKQLAIQHIGFGAATKYYLEFENPWWPEDYSGTFPLWNDHNYTNSSLNYWRSDITKEELMEEYDGLPLWTRSILAIFTVDLESAPKMMRTWVTGMPSRFLDEMDPTYLQETTMAVIHKFLDATIPNITNPIRSYQSKWASNPFTRGVYSYRTMESEENNVWARDLADPILNTNTLQPLICFAGEATNPTHFATVHGAYDTGVREFVRILVWNSSR